MPAAPANVASLEVGLPVAFAIAWRLVVSADACEAPVQDEKRASRTAAD